MNARRFWIPFAVFVGLTPIMLFIGLISSGVGHGDYFLAKILFPYTMLSTAAFDRVEPPFVFLTFIQYPVYGVVIGLANVRRKLLISGGVLAVIHVLAVIAALRFATFGVYP